MLTNPLQAATPRAPPDSLRDCVADAVNAAAIAACEKQAATALKQRVRELSDILLARLSGDARRLFAANDKAWRDWVARETALIDLTLGRRTDGLGPALRPGAINTLYEQRVRQLEQHLYSLNQGPPGGAR